MVVWWNCIFGSWFWLVVLFGWFFRMFEFVVGGEYLEL